MSEELQLAAQVHYSFLPEDYEDDRLNIAVTLLPLHPIGGDYCSIIPLDSERVLVSLCDAVGHDVASALFAARINTYVLTHARTDLIPCDIVAGLNSYLCKHLAKTGMYATFFSLLLDFASGTMTLSGAAHPPVLQFQKGQNCCKQWPSMTTFLGISDPMPLLCGTERLQLNTGDRFLLYSDGLIEVENTELKAFGIEGLSSSLISHQNLSGQELNNAILTQAKHHANKGFNDDVLLVSIALK